MFIFLFFSHLIHFLKLWLINIIIQISLGIQIMLYIWLFSLYFWFVQEKGAYKPILSSSFFCMVIALVTISYWTCKSIIYLIWLILQVYIHSHWLPFPSLTFLYHIHKRISFTALSKIQGSCSSLVFIQVPNGRLLYSIWILFINIYHNSSRNVYCFLFFSFYFCFCLCFCLCYDLLCTPRHSFLFCNSPYLICFGSFFFSFSKKKKKILLWVTRMDWWSVGSRKLSLLKCESDTAMTMCVCIRKGVSPPE